MARNVTRLASSLVTLMDQTINVEHDAVVDRDPSGAPIRSWVTKTSNIACNVQPMSARRIVEYRRNEVEVSHTIYFNSDPGIGEGERFNFGGRIFKKPEGARNTDELDVLWVVDVQEEK